MVRFFISYSHKDYDLVQRRIIKALASEYGRDQIWYDVDLQAGENWRNELVQQIQKCDVFLFCISDNSLQSDYCTKELQIAVGADKPIIPLLIGTVTNNLPHELETRQYIDILDGLSKVRLSKLKDAIHKAVQNSDQNYETPSQPIHDNSINVRGDYIGSVSKGSIGKQVIENQINQNIFLRFTKKALFYAIFIVVLIILVVYILNRLNAPAPEPSIAYEFLIDTSAEMNNLLNGVTRYQIAYQAIKQIADTPALTINQTWRGLRLAGGGDQCNQTEMVTKGTGDQLSSEQLIAPLNTLIPSGNNSTEAGIRATFGDLTLPEVQKSKVKVVFIMLGSLNLDPCRPFDIATALSSYTTLGISTTFCTFTLVEDLEDFEQFRRQMLERGFGCVHNVEKPEEISKIAVSIILQLVRQAKGEEVQLTPNRTPTPVVYVGSTATNTIIPSHTLTNTQESSSTPAVTNNPTQTPITLSATNTLLSPSITFTQEPTITHTFSPSPTKTSLPSTATKTLTPTPKPTITSTNKPILTATPIQPTITLNPTLITFTPTPTYTLTPTTKFDSTNQVFASINAASVNLRSGPSTAFSVVGSAQNGDTFQVIASNGNNSDLWYLIVRSNGSRAWIADRVVSLSSQTVNIIVAATIPAQSNIQQQPTTTTTCKGRFLIGESAPTRLANVNFGGRVPLWKNNPPLTFDLPSGTLWTYENVSADSNFAGWTGESTFVTIIDCDNSYFSYKVRSPEGVIGWISDSELYKS